MEAPWYAISDMPPPYTIHVWVLWEGRRFRAVRGRHLKTGADVWAAVRDGGQLQIINRIGTTGAPRLWQPLHPDKWAGLLPVPVSPVIQDRVVSEHLRFDALEHATSEELARDMEEMRESARNSHGFPVEPRGIAWWHDASQIKYEPKGQVTKRHCEGRLMRALSFSGAGKRRGCPVPPTAKALASLAEAVDTLCHDDDAADEREFLRLKMLPSDQSDFLTALDWFTRLNPPEFWRKDRETWSFSRVQRVLLARALPIAPSFGDIAATFHIVGGGSEAKRIYELAVDKCMAAANGLPMHDQPIVDRMTVLRERNRAARRAQA